MSRCPCFAVAITMSSLHNIFPKRCLKCFSSRVSSTSLHGRWAVRRRQGSLSCGHALFQAERKSGQGGALLPWFVHLGLVGMETPR